jgi:CRP/FNR family cyclic AMP-dependent transcriptional regulator
VPIHAGEAGGKVDAGTAPGPILPIAGVVRTSSRCVLDLDADLAEELAPEARRVARAAATATVLDAEAGPLAMVQWLERAGGGPGVLVLQGVLTLGVRVGDRLSAELAGGGDLLQQLWTEPNQLIGCTVKWRALTPMRFAILDAAFARRVRFWPQLLHALLRRSGRRAVNLNVQRAIAAQPRLEVRLALLFWHLAGRWGRVEPGGIRLPVPLTHQLLGQLIGAERPSVSHALARLAEAGLVDGHGDEWHLHGALHDQLPAMVAASEDRAERILAAVGGRRQG